MAYNLSRMTIYAMVSAIEEDLREIIRSHLGSKSTSDKSFDQALLDRAKIRLEKDNSYGYDSDTLASLVDYFDLGDTYQLINSHPDKSPLKNPQSPNARKALMSAAACQNYQ
ncbi:hypothetical protein, partial [Xanthomonas campestris]|uniref:hypothetical protein n=1 Tax=Xanthomonas campestris TaxID=339 RepID=UPI002B22CC4E